MHTADSAAPIVVIDRVRKVYHQGTINVAALTDVLKLMILELSDTRGRVQ